MKHLEVAAGILVYNNKILCTQRNVHKYSYLSFKYEFPGGKLEPGETKSEALMRELNEELDLKVSVSEDDFFKTVSYTYPDFSVTLHFYLCHLQSDAFTLKEHAGFKWLQTDELKTLDWAPADVPIVEELEKRGI